MQNELPNSVSARYRPRWRLFRTDISKQFQHRRTVPGAAVHRAKQLIGNPRCLSHWLHLAMSPAFTQCERLLVLTLWRICRCLPAFEVDFGAAGDKRFRGSKNVGVSVRPSHW